MAGEILEAGAVRGTVQAAGRRLEYEWIGPEPAAAPTLVFLHDGLGCVDTWRDFPVALAAATGCGALVYSRAGYGGSDGLPGPWPESFMHDEARIALPQVIAALGVRDGFLVGHSDGASISLIYAAVRPSWLRGMVLEAPHVFVEPATLESIAKLPGLYRQSALWRRMVRNHGANAAGCFESWVDVWLRPEFRSWSIRDLLPRVRNPLLAIQGERDAYGTLDQIRFLEAGCGCPVETLLLADCGHTPHRQRRDATLLAMTAFIRRLL